MSDVTQILNAIGRGEPHAADELLPLVYEELRQLAAAQLAQENPGQTLQATALVHEAWLRLVGSPHGETAPRWDGRRHFFGAAAEAMRRILVENARRKQSPKYGGGLQRVNWERVELAEAAPPEQLLALDEALEELTRLDPEAAELIKLRFYAGLTDEQAATVLGVSRRTAIRLWAYARAWLYRALRGQPSGGG